MKNSFSHEVYNKFSIYGNIIYLCGINIINLWIQNQNLGLFYTKMLKSFLSRVEPKTRQKILDNMGIARSTLDPRLLKKLTGDVWEFRTLYNGKQYRMLAFWDKRNNVDTLVVTTYGFIKKVSQVPKKEIAKTEQIMKEYFNQ